MTQLPARKIAACFNNICFWRERKPLQWAAFAHVQSGHTDVTTLLREVQAACSQCRFAAHAVPLRREGTCRMVIYSIRSESHKFEPLERYPLPTPSEIPPRPFLRPLFIELAPAFNSERSIVENLHFPVIPTMLDYSVATLELLPPNSDSHPARALILAANFLKVTQRGHFTGLSLFYC